MSQLEPVRAKQYQSSSLKSTLLAQSAMKQTFNLHSQSLWIMAFNRVCQKKYDYKVKISQVSVAFKVNVNV
jgi:hypothetical protein